MNGNFPGRTATDLVPMLYHTDVGALLPFCSSWGGYTLVYYTQDGGSLCSDCATDALLDVLGGSESWPDYTPVICDAPEESEYDVRCDDCNRLLIEGYAFDIWNEEN